MNAIWPWQRWLYLAASICGLAALTAGGGGVVLGRGGALLLAGRPRTYHVRLDGPPARRAALAARIEGIPLERAVQRQARTARARTLWVKRLYRADPTNPSWYHLWLDTTALGPDSALEVVAHAVGLFAAGGG